MPDAPLMTVHEAMRAVRRDVGAVRKTDTNTQQGYNFRGIDAVVQALAVPLDRHGVIVSPGQVLRFDHGTVEVGSRRTPMSHVTVLVEYLIVGPAGDTFAVQAPGEAMDSGDKATAKAMSVALRTAMLQAFMLPTDDPDPDSHTYQRSPQAAMSEADRYRASLLEEVRAAAYALAVANGKPGESGVDYAARQWQAEHGHPIAETTDLGSLEILRDDLQERARVKAREAGSDPHDAARETAIQEGAGGVG